MTFLSPFQKTFFFLSWHVAFYPFALNMPFAFYFLSSDFIYMYPFTSHYLCIFSLPFFSFAVLPFPLSPFEFFLQLTAADTTPLGGGGIFPIYGPLA
jgi:hypothetical protein